MNCRNCGNPIEPGQKVCYRCGANLLENGLNSYNSGSDNADFEKPINDYLGNDDINNIRKHAKNFNNIEEDRKRSVVVPVTIGLSCLFIILLINIYIIFSNIGKNYFFYDDISLYQDEESVSQTIEEDKNNDAFTSSSSTKKKSKSKSKKKTKTSIDTDNVYYDISINSSSDAYELIREDSLSQKDDDYPEDILDIENDIIRKYSITAVDLKELDPELAKELEDVIDEIYTLFPSVKGNLTNFTLINYGFGQSDTIAAFRPLFEFAYSNRYGDLPMVMKTRMELNSKYFLDEDYLETTMESCSDEGWFPPNSNRCSGVSHELGHYLSFVAMMRYHNLDSVLIIDDDKYFDYYSILMDFDSGDFSKKLLDEAYQNYTKDKGYIDFDKWRGEISGYALAKDEYGDYIYDETIAEAFHDYYLNGNNACDTSKYIIKVLQKYIERR